MRGQSAATFLGVIGLSSLRFPTPWGDCTEAQVECGDAPDGQETGIRDGLKVDRESLDLVTFYAPNLVEPGRRRTADLQVLRGVGAGFADNCPEGRATGTEWKTPPLRGIGLTQQVSEHAQFFCDGRAMTLPEAILWHVGAVQAPRDAVVALPRADRDALIAFLESL